jgi:hypothetical protein
VQYSGKLSSETSKCHLTQNRQDLNCSILVGSKRIVDHTTFAELAWRRDSVDPNSLQLPPGFQKLSHVFNHGFIEALKDIQALQHIRDVYQSSRRQVSMVRINSHTASIQSRLAALPATTSVMKSCYLAAYICSVMLCCTVWCGLVIPVGVCRRNFCSLSDCAV